ncbi:MAG: beta-lactamase family protein [Chitinivibrionales bacterium]|nr:beta-lactamase family protein [Chitinivibrionales bacterium]
MRMWIALVITLFCTSAGFTEVIHPESGNELSTYLHRANLTVESDDQGTAPDMLLDQEYTAAYQSYQHKKRQYRRYLDSLIAASLKETGTIGLSISVVSANDVLFLKGYGMADLKESTPVTPQTLFHVGSISKLFTGIAIMQLVQKRRVDLDAPLTTYIPEFSYKSHYPDAKQITVRHLMTHQSGLVGDILKEWVALSLPRPDFHHLPNSFSKEYLAYPPEYISSYSNSGVALLGLVIERVSGMAFRRYIKKNILNPCGMTFSNFSRRPYMEPYFSKSYNADSSENPYWYIRDIAAGDLISNAPEMARFISMILHQGSIFNNRILRKSSLAAMFTQQNSHVSLDFPNDHGTRWGLSWILNNEALDYAGQYVGHDGALPHYYASMNILPQHGLGVIVMVNSEVGQAVVFKTADAAVMKALELFKGITPPAPKPLPPLTSLTEEQIHLMTGTYATNEYGLLSCGVENDTLRVHSPVIGNLQCIPHTDNWFSIYDNGIPLPQAGGIRFGVQKMGAEKIFAIEIRDTNGAIYCMSQGVEYNVPLTPNPQWQARQANYVITNPDSLMFIDSVFTLTQFPGNVFYIFQSGGFISVLDPINDFEGQCIGRGRNVNQTIQMVDHDNQRQLYFLGYYFKTQERGPQAATLSRSFALTTSPFLTTDEMITEHRIPDVKLWKRK